MMKDSKHVHTGNTQKSVLCYERVMVMIPINGDGESAHIGHYEGHKS